MALRSLRGDYVVCISEFYPDLQVSCFGDPTVYENIQVEAGGVLPSQAELDACALTRAKRIRIEDLSEECRANIESGVVSSALGTPHMYDSEQVDQLNATGTTLSISPYSASPDGGSSEYAVRPIVDGVTQAKVYVSHTYLQMRQVMADGVAFKLALLQNFNNKRDYINNVAASIADVEAVTWSSNP